MSAEVQKLDVPESIKTLGQILEMCQLKVIKSLAIPNGIMDSHRGNRWGSSILLGPTAREIFLLEKIKQWRTI